MRFLIDCQLPRSLAETLRQRGYAADHASDFGLKGAPDREIWRYAIEKECVIVSKDEDFSLLAKSTTNGPAVLWIRLGNTRNRVLSATLLPLMPLIVAAIEAGERLIEIR